MCAEWVAGATVLGDPYGNYTSGMGSAEDVGITAVKARYRELPCNVGVERRPIRDWLAARHAVGDPCTRDPLGSARADVYR